MEHPLICEGRCNPNLSAIDAIVRESLSRGDGVCVRVNDREADIQRSLVYTPHRVAANMGHCLICGTTRRYGNSGLLS